MIIFFSILFLILEGVTEDGGGGEGVTEDGGGGRGVRGALFQ